LFNLFLKKIKNSFYKKYLKNASWLLAGKIFRMFAGFIVGVWVIRYLGPEDAGLLSYAQSFVGLFVAFSTLGLDSIVVRELVKFEEKRDSLLGTAFRLKLMGGFLTLFIILVAFHFTDNSFYTNAIVFIIASSTVFQSFNVIDFYFKSKVLSQYIFYSNFFALTFSSIFKIGLILCEAEVIYFALAIAFDSLVLVFGLVYFYHSRGYKVANWQFNKKLAFELLGDSWPLILAYMSYLIYSRIDQIMMKNMLGQESVGYYAAAFKLYSIIPLIPMSIASSISPLITSYYHSGLLKKLHKTYYFFSSIMTLAAYLILVVIYLCSDNLIFFLFGPDFKKSAFILVILVLGLIPIFNGFLRSTFITVTNNQQIIFYTTFFAACLNVILNYYWIRAYGVYGSAYATVVSQFISLTLSNLFFKETRKIFMIQIKSLFLIGLFRSKDEFSIIQK
jgi:O-antigen/teichoic acid export membrane protein